MRKKIAVLVVHGMGSQGQHFAEEMIEELNNRVSRLSKDPNSIAWKPVYWADILEPAQSKYLNEAKKNHDIDFVDLRKFTLTALGDATAYQKVSGNENNAYERIHERVKEKVSDLYRVSLEEHDCPLIVLAHSLGGHIMSNYIWDMQNTVDDDISAFEKMKYLAGMVTFGCNIPLFTFAYQKVVPIDFPGQFLSDEYKSKAKWKNYYDPDDILGYPLKAINADYANTVDDDIAINVGGLFSGWNPACHSAYWTDNNFTKPVSKFIGEFL
ncbi:MAG: hypothetical protein GXP08_09175 [Gammaproteobacteria bacterium]|nr:hypothetical protein [Gammaproteobacteria bacterium]